MICDVHQNNEYTVVGSWICDRGIDSVQGERASPPTWPMRTKLASACEAVSPVDGRYRWNGKIGTACIPNMRRIRFSRSLVNGWNSRFYQKSGKNTISEGEKPDSELGIYLHTKYEANQAIGFSSRLVIKSILRISRKNVISQAAKGRIAWKVAKPTSAGGYLPRYQISSESVHRIRLQPC